MTAAEQEEPDDKAATRRSGGLSALPIAGFWQHKALKAIDMANENTAILAFIFSPPGNLLYYQRLGTTATLY
jgi:hypothetical protein